MFNRQQNRSCSTKTEWGLRTVVWSFDLSHTSQSWQISLCLNSRSHPVVFSNGKCYPVSLRKIKQWRVVKFSHRIPAFISFPQDLWAVVIHHQDLLASIFPLHLASWIRNSCTWKRWSERIPGHGLCPRASFTAGKRWFATDFFWTQFHTLFDVDRAGQI